MVPLIISSLREKDNAPKSISKKSAHFSKEIASREEGACETRLPEINTGDPRLSLTYN